VAYAVARKRRHALCAGLFATFSGFYMAYWVTPDNFAPFAVAGALCLWATGRGLETGKASWFCISGLCAGFAHLSRADGVLLVGIVLLSVLLHIVRSQSPIARFAMRYSLFAICYLLVMGPWFVRNVQVIGSPMSTYGMQGAWLTQYDDLFSYGKPLTAQSFLAWGWGNILQSRLKALWINAGTVLFVGWMIFLCPFGLIGAWRLARRPAFHAAWLYGVALYLAMSLVFTFPGWRGGMLHSTVALLPFLYAAAMEGLDVSINWVSRLRRAWRPRQAQTVFAVAFVVFAVVLSGVLYVRGLHKYEGTHLYSEVALWMSEHVSPSSRVLVNDPALFYYHSRRECAAIPNAELGTVLEVMDRYGIAYLLLDENYVPLRALYEAPQSDERLVLVKTFVRGGVTVYLFGVSDRA
jgi:hypothetical protein